MLSCIPGHWTISLLADVGRAVENANAYTSSTYPNLTTPFRTKTNLKNGQAVLELYKWCNEHDYIEIFFGSLMSTNKNKYFFLCGYKFNMSLFGAHVSYKFYFHA